MKERDLNSAAEIIRRNQTFLIACHVRPDGDTLGSAISLTMALNKMGKSVVTLSVDGVPEIYSFLPGSENVVVTPPQERFDVAIIPDCDGVDRVGSAVDAVKRAGVLIGMDHHRSGPSFGDVGLFDTTAAATGEIVLELIDHLGVEIDRDMAVCLMAAIVSDTGAFRFPNVTPRTLRHAARLTEAGVSPSRIAELVYETRSMASIHLLGIALASVKSDETGEIVWGRLTREDFSNAKATDADTDGIINHIRTVKSAKVAMLFREAPDGATLVSLRSKNSIDVNKIARVFGGGGHAAAAGCTVHAPIDEAERLVVEEVRKCMAS